MSVPAGHSPNKLPAVARWKEDGLINAQELFVVEGVEKHHSYTSIKIKSNIQDIHKIGLKYIDEVEVIIKKREELL